MAHDRLHGVRHDASLGSPRRWSRRRSECNPDHRSDRYEQDATQAEIADRLGTSRATVSRLLSEARRSGIVRIQVVPQVDAQDAELARWCAELLGLATVHISPMVSSRKIGSALAPAPGLYEVLRGEPSIRRVLELWESARCAVLGVGAPPLLRQSLPGFVPTDAVSLRAAVGDVCSRFFDRAGQPVPFPGLERLFATPLDALRRTPVSIGVAAGQTKVPGIIVGARGGYFNQLVTDGQTAAAAVAAIAEEPAAPGHVRR